MGPHSAEERDCISICSTDESAIPEDGQSVRHSQRECRTRPSGGVRVRCPDLDRKQACVCLNHMPSDGTVKLSLAEFDGSVHHNHNVRRYGLGFEAETRQADKGRGLESGPSMARLGVCVEVLLELDMFGIPRFSLAWTSLRPIVPHSYSLTHSEDVRE